MPYISEEELKRYKALEPENKRLKAFELRCQALEMERKIHQEESQGILKEIIQAYNLLSETIREQKLQTQKEIARTTAQRMQSLQQEPDQNIRCLKVIAYIKQSTKVISEGLKARPPAIGNGETARPQAITKLQLRAQALIGRVKEIASGGGRSLISITSRQAEELITGLEGEQPSCRRDILLCMERAAQLWPALNFASISNDRRGTKKNRPGFKGPH